MERRTCPFCHQECLIADKDSQLSVNGRGFYKTKIWFHRSCFDKEVEKRYQESQRIRLKDIGGVYETI